MKYKQFDVVKLNNGDKATILAIIDDKYKVEIVDDKGKRKEITEIYEYNIDEYVLKKSDIS